MRFKRLGAGVAAALTMACGSAAVAQTLPPGVTLPQGGILPTGITTTVNLSDGTRLEQTILSPTTMRINITGGPQFGSNPATVNVTNLVLSGTEVLYSGNVVIGGSTTAFNCRMNTATSSVSGDAICGTAFGGSSAPTTPAPVTPTTPPVVTTTTTTSPTTTTTTTTITPTSPTGGTGPTVVSIQVTAQEQAFISDVRAEQFFLAMVGDRAAITDAYAFAIGRLQALEMMGLAPGGLTLGRAANRGMAAGAGPYRPGLWLNANGGWLKDRRVAGGIDGRHNSVAVGGDLTGDKLTLGAYVAYSDLDMDGASADFTTKGWTGSLYARFTPSSQFRVTAMVGKGRQDVNYSRTSGALVSRGKTDRDQKFGSVTVDSLVSLGGGWVAVPTASVLMSDSYTESYTDQAGRAFAGASSDLTLGSAGTSIYYTRSRVMPFLQLSGSHQFNQQAGVDRTYATVGGGFVAGIGRGASILAGAQTLAWKRGERETRVAVTLRQSF